MLLEKNAKVSIILPLSPGVVERFAAEELMKYLRISLDIRAVITDKVPGDGNIFFLGAWRRNKLCTDFFEENELRQRKTGEEGFYLELCGSTALIAGSDDCDDEGTGTLYGVYEFLERCIGCCFAAFCAEGVNAGELVPRYESLELDDFSYHKPSADLSYRTAIVQYSNWAANADRRLNIPFIDWLCKNRYNRILTWVSVYEKYKEIGMLPELEKRGIHLSVGHHESACTWLPHFGNDSIRERYYETHPEFYRLLADGTRFVPKSREDRMGQWIYCSRNPACIEEVSKNIINWVGENPIVDVIAFWPNDGSDEQCCCEECAKYSKTTNYAYFQNEVAKRIQKKYPHMKIDMLVYQDLWDCPDSVEFCDAIMIDESTWTPQGLRHAGKEDGSCLIGTNCDRNLMEWKKKCENVVYYDYYMGVYSNKQRIIPMADEIGTIFKYFVKTGIKGSGTQIECFNVWNHLLNFYTFGRTAYDTSLSFEDQLLKIGRLYGEAGDVIAEIFRLYEQALDGEAPLDEGGRFFMKQIDSKKVYSLFDRALDAAKTATERNNVRLSRMAFRYTDLEVNDPIAVADRDQQLTLRYADPTGELGYMATNYDSFTRNDPGFAITIPAENTAREKNIDKWYAFEN